MTKPTKWHVRPAKTQIRLGFQSDQSLRCPHEETLGPQLPTERTANTEQTGRVPRLIWVFAWHTGYFVGFVIGRHIPINLELFRAINKKKAGDSYHKLDIHGCSITQKGEKQKKLSKQTRYLTFCSYPKRPQTKRFALHLQIIEELKSWYMWVISPSSFYASVDCKDHYFI